MSSEPRYVVIRLSHLIAVCLIFFGGILSLSFVDIGIHDEVRAKRFVVVDSLDNELWKWDHWSLSSTSEDSDHGINIFPTGTILCYGSTTSTWINTKSVDVRAQADDDSPYIFDGRATLSINKHGIPELWMFDNQGSNVFFSNLMPGQLTNSNTDSAGNAIQRSLCGYGGVELSGMNSSVSLSSHRRVDRRVSDGAWWYTTDDGGGALRIESGKDTTTMFGGRSWFSGPDGVVTLGDNYVHIYEDKIRASLGEVTTVDRYGNETVHQPGTIMLFNSNGNVIYQQP